MSSVSRFNPAHRPPEHIDTPVVCCAFPRGKLLVQRAGGAPHLPRLDPAQWTATPENATMSHARWRALFCRRAAA